MKCILSCVALASCMMLASTSAWADGGDAFGRKGQFVPSGDLSLYGEWTKSPGGSSSSSVTFSASPMLGYFVIDNVLVGAGLYAAVRAPEGGSSSSGLGFSLRGGYNYNLLQSISILPELILNYASTSLTVSGDKYTSNVFALEIFVPVLWHVVPHFFVGIGPDFHTDLSSTTSVGNASGDGSKVTAFGLATTIGGWL